jgi:hypothetical protein
MLMDLYRKLIREQQMKMDEVQQRNLEPLHIIAENVSQVKQVMKDSSSKCELLYMVSLDLSC